MLDLVYFIYFKNQYDLTINYLFIFIVFAFKMVAFNFDATNYLGGIS